MSERTVINEVTGEAISEEELNLNRSIAVADVNALVTDDFLDMLERYDILGAQVKKWFDEHNDEIMDLMENAGLKSIKTRYKVFQYLAPHTQNRLDAKKLKEELPEVYDKYLRESTVKRSLRITDRKD